MVDDDLDILLFCSFRYALGRRSYITSAVADILIENMNKLYPNSRDLVMKEIREAIDQDRAGMEMDCCEWRKVLKHFGEHNATP